MGHRSPLDDHLATSNRLRLLTSSANAEAPDAVLKHARETRGLDGAHCDLCEAARITPWFHEDEICWIAECQICRVPMVVWRFHGTEPPTEHLRHMHDKLGRVAGDVLTVDHYIDDDVRKIPDHYHAHARPRVPPVTAAAHR